MVEVALRTVPESVCGVKTSLSWNIRPLVETKMPLTYQVSGITYQKKNNKINKTKLNVMLHEPIFNDDFFIHVTRRLFTQLCSGKGWQQYVTLNVTQDNF